MASLAPTLKALINSIPTRPVRHDTLDNLVKSVLLESQHKVSAENRKSQWEYLLKNEIFNLAVSVANILFLLLCCLYHIRQRREMR